MQVLYLDWIRIWRCWFLWKERDRRNQRGAVNTQLESNWGQTGGGQALATLHHLCSPYSWPWFTLSTDSFWMPVDKVTSLNSAGRVLIKIDIRLTTQQEPSPLG